jgi:hypothetical protein
MGHHEDNNNNAKRECRHASIYVYRSTCTTKEGKKKTTQTKTTEHMKAPS